MLKYKGFWGNYKTFTPNYKTFRPRYKDFGARYKTFAKQKRDPFEVPLRVLLFLCYLSLLTTLMTACFSFMYLGFTWYLSQRSVLYLMNPLLRMVVANVLFGHA